MKFDYEYNKTKMNNASNDMNTIIDNYNNKISNLNDKEKSTLELYFALKKMNTLSNMTPKGDYYNDKIKLYIDKCQLFINKLIHYLYGDIKNNNDFNNKLNEDMKDIYILLSNFENDLKETYKRNNSSVYTVLPIQHLSELKPSIHRENQYLNSINDGVFAISDYDSLQKYIARACTSGMIVRGSNIVYSTNPFDEVCDDYIKLNKKVSIYESNVDDYKPQYDLVIDSNLKPKIVFDGEWISSNKNIKVKENITDYLPISFIEENNIFIGDEQEQIVKNNKKSSI